jgi:hypothetical protein
MAIHSSNVVLRAKWARGWELMRAGKTSEGYDLLAGVTLSDLQAVTDAEHPEPTCKRVQTIIERQPPAEAGGELTVMDVLIRAAKRGDHEASDLLVFGDLEGLEAAE